MIRVHADYDCRYMLLQPLLQVFTKSSTAALQSVLHVLFLPTPFKVLPRKPKSTNEEKANPHNGKVMPEELLKPGALYSECAMVRLEVTLPKEIVTAKENDALGADESKDASIPDDGELGGELAGRLVWEAFEEELKRWTTANPPESMSSSEENKGSDKRETVAVAD
jgi:hypothetical protein